MPTLTLRGQSSPVTAIALTLSIEAGPLLELHLPHNHPWKHEHQRAAFNLLGERGELAWEEETISFRCTGLRMAAGGRDAATGVALSDETFGWFEALRTRDSDVQLLVYQRQQADANGWAFLRRVLGDRFSRPHGADALDIGFPVGACVLRQAGCDNLTHLRRVLSLLTTGPTRAYGWCAFDASQGDDPLRLLSLDAPALELDREWAASERAGLHIPQRLEGRSGASTLLRSFGAITVQRCARLLRELTRTGAAGAGEGLVEEHRQLPCLPSPIALGTLGALSTELRYQFDLRHIDTQQQAELEVSLRCTPLPSTPAQPAVRFTSSGLFARWNEPSDKTRIEVTPGDAPWRMMGDADSTDTEAIDEEKSLVCDAVTPYAGRGDFAGFYVSRRSDDRLIVELGDSEVPRAMGQLQVYAESLEAPDVVINSETITLSGLGKQAELETADGIAVDGASGTVEVFAERHVRLKQKVKVTEERTEIEHDTKISGTLDVGS